jgi:hypothetical protein
VGSFYVIGICTIGYDGYYSKGLDLGLVSITQALHFYQHHSDFWGKNEGYAPMCFSVGYWPIRNLCSSESWSTLFGVNYHPVLQANGYVAYVSTVLSRRVLTYCWYGRLQSPCVGSIK